MMKRPGWRLVGVLLLGLALRSIALQARSIQYDDAFSIFLAKKSLPAIISGTAADTMPPLYYFLLHFWILLGGTGLVWLRLLSVILSLGCFILLYLVVRDSAGETAGLWAAFLAAISPLQIYHAQDLRMYALLALAQLGYIWFFVRILNMRHRDPMQLDGKNSWPGWVNWLGLVLCGIAAMYTHNLAVFVLVVPDFYLLARREWRALGRLIVAQLGIVLAALPWLWLVPGQIAKIQAAFWTPRPGIVEILQACVLLVTQLPLPGTWLVGGLVLGLLVVGFVLLETVRQVRKRSLPWFLLALAILPPVLLFAASYLMRPVFVPRGFLAATLGFLGLCGVMIARSWPQIPAYLILGGLIAGAGIGLPFHYTFNEFPRSPFQPAMAFIQAQFQTGDRVIHDNKLSYFPSRYYSPAMPQAFLADDPGSPNDTLAPASQAALGLYPEASLAQAVGDSGKVWFVVFSETVQEYRQAGIPDHPQVAWLKAAYPLSHVTQFNDLIVVQFFR